MDQDNFVAPYNGGWVVYVKGLPLRGDNPDGTFSNQQAAENAFNSLAGQQQDTGYPYGDWLKSQADSNERRFAESTRQYNASLAEQQRATNLNNASNFALGVMSTATRLAGTPKDWVTYANYTTGGKDIFNRLYGDKAAPAFGVAGYSQPKTVQDLMKDLRLA